MITVIGFVRNDLYYNFTIDNHGDPIVCAAVSALSINLANSLQYIAHEKVFTEIDDGHLSIYLPHREKGMNNQKTTILIQAYILGIDSITMEHPKEVIFLKHEISEV